MMFGLLFLDGLFYTGRLKMLGLQGNAAEVFQQVRQEYGEAHTGGTVDDAVVEGQAQRTQSGEERTLCRSKPV